MAVIGRILMVILAYILACIAAAIVLALGTLAPDWEDLAGLGLQSVVAWSAVGVGAAMIAFVATPPSLLVIALAEGFAWRSSILYALLGGALALALRYGLDFAGQIGALPSYLGNERELVAAAGIAGGLVYWAFAGRKAGSWK